ncbi:MAG: hypothetical protein ACXU95_06960, partial [Isosphaeraceae bacterium]
MQSPNHDLPGPDPQNANRGGCRQEALLGEGVGPLAVDLDMTAWPQRGQCSPLLANQDLEMMIGVRHLDLLGRRGLE